MKIISKRTLRAVKPEAVDAQLRRQVHIETGPERSLLNWVAVVESGLARGLSFKSIVNRPRDNHELRVILDWLDGRYTIS